ncbi:flavoprotein NADH-dependent oxidoreductase [Roridomyces roridus]|uniref:Flavoprotein NADH-dependent oxidoreductase n=1 Tax=Roridomyces roridus TaxID=1738132 RepID=A0AAD7FEY6_9AGAR|nr:flavoprotein NADH-dependent oxidoreductase [Roridomyces roridus]
MSSALFTPLKVGSVTVPNRIGMSALTRSRSSATVPNDIMKLHYDQRAAGGAGLIVTEAILIARQGTEWPNAPGIWNDEQVAGWKKIVDSIYAQLWHVGRVAHPKAPEQIAAGVPVYAPSAISARGGKFRHIEGATGYVTPTEVPDPTILIALFKEAAVNAKKAGFDGVELHGANGYLIHQFLDSTSNTRTDQWGGSVENRARFALETLKAVIEVFGPDVAIKVSPAGGYNDMGMPLQETLDTFGYLLREVDKLNLSYVCLARYSPWLDVEFDGKKRATPHDIPETYTPFLPTTQIWVNTDYTPEEAEKTVSSGKAAGVFFDIPWISHPDVGNRIRKGKPLDNPPVYATFYGAPGVDPAKGYTDYKAAED